MASTSPPRTAAKNVYADHCAELLSVLGPVKVTRMFGGHGFYVDDVFIALAAHDVLFLKADDATRARFEAAGCHPFTFEANGKAHVTSYWNTPEDAMESPALMLPWARLAMEAALRTRNAKPGKKKPVKKQAVAVKKTAAATRPQPTTAPAKKRSAARQR